MAGPLPKSVNLPLTNREFSRYRAGMTFTDQIIAAATAYACALGIPLKTASSRIFNETKLLDRVVDGRATLTLARAEKALVWLSENWPEGAVWPEGMDRPAQSREAAE